MSNFRIDFAMNRGHEMLIDRENGIYRNELEDIELNMLRSSRIPYMLPMDWLEIDGKVTLRYTLTGLRMLVHRLQQQPLTMEQYYYLVLGVTDALSECKDYMLRPEGCLLNDQFIFIGEQLHDIRIAYVPICSKADEQVLGTSELLTLVVRWTSYVEHIDGQGLKRILQHLNEKRWPLSELRETLLELIAGRPLVDTSIQSQKSISQAASILSNSKTENIQINNRHVSGTPISETPIRNTISSLNDEVQPYIEEDEPQQRKWQWLASALLILAIAAVWRFSYLANPTRGSLLVSVGISLLLAAGILWAWRQQGSRLLVSSADNNISQEEFEPESGALFKREIWNWRNEEFDVDAVDTDTIGQVKKPISALDQSPSLLDARDNNRSSAPTVLLSRQPASTNLETVVSNKTSVCLLRVWEGQEAIIELAEPHFKIGRASEQVSYLESADGVSRIHLEIEQTTGGHCAKDLGSRNGSLLNGNLMVPYKSYKLMAGDLIHLAGEKGPTYELKSI